LDTGKYLAGQIDKIVNELRLPEVANFDKLNCLANLSINTQRNYLQRLLEFSRATKRAYRKPLTELSFDEIVDILDRMKKGQPARLS